MRKIYTIKFTKFELEMIISALQEAGDEYQEGSWYIPLIEVIKKGIELKEDK